MILPYLVKFLGLLKGQSKNTANLNSFGSTVWSKTIDYERISSEKVPNNVKKNEPPRIVFQSPELNEQYAKYASENQDNQTHKIYIERFNSKSSKLNKKKQFFIILEYTKIFSQTKFCDMSVNAYFYKNDNLFQKIVKEKKLTKVFDLLSSCAYKNCFFTCDKSLISESDALIFHDADLKNDIINNVKNVEDEIEVNSFVHQYLKFERDPEQVWILWSDEPNTVIKPIDSFNFNWTISYNSQSEISYGTYGIYNKVEGNFKSDLEYRDHLKKQFMLRKNDSVWFVSNCEPKYRMNFVAQLSNFYPVNMFGKCLSGINAVAGEKKYLSFYSDPCTSGSECEKEVLSKSKFYLAIESQNCTDYVTEKFWRTLNHFLIPIVAQPNKKVYERVAPRNSFIHLADFGFDPLKLAKYLEKVAQDFTLYSSYFEWKKYFKTFYKREDLEKLRICELCFKLNARKYDSFNSYYKSTSSWFNGHCAKN